MSKKKIVGIIQARMGSTRLPGKVMLPMGLNNTSLSLTADHVAEGIGKYCAENRDYTYEVVIASTTKKLDSIIEYYTCKYLGINCSRGSEKNVLERTYACAKKYEADIIVDVTSDCPFVQPDHIREILDLLVTENAEHSSNVLVRCFPDGLDAQAYTFQMLEKMHFDPRSNIEHSGWNAIKLYREKANVKLACFMAIDEYNHPNWRWTLDTVQDYIVMNRMVQVVENDSKKCKREQDFSIGNLKRIYLEIEAEGWIKYEKS